MKIGIGLPNVIPGREAEAITRWAQAAEQANFSTLAAIDRIVYPNFEPLLTLAAAATVTKRIRLATTVLITPVRPNTALLAKQVATLDNLSGGRFVLGVGVGGREDDYTGSGIETKGRGAMLTEQLLEMKRIWGGENRGVAGPIGPAITNGKGPEIWVGGGADVALTRAAKLGDGWIFAGGPAGVFAQMAAKVDDAWAAQGRDGRPYKSSLAFFSLGADARANADSYVHAYYGWLGEEIANMVAASVAVSPDAVQQQMLAFEQAGCDELIIFPCSNDPQQVELLASATGKT